MEISQDQYSEFRSIVNDISESDILKYLKMAKGNLNLALNYYYNSIAKQDLKNSRQTIPNQTSAFSHLIESSKNQAKLEKIYKDLKKDYSKPVQSSITSSQKEIKTNKLDLCSNNFQNMDSINEITGNIMKKLDNNMIVNVKEEYKNNLEDVEKEIKLIEFSSNEKEDDLNLDVVRAKNHIDHTTIKRNYSQMASPTYDKKENNNEIQIEILTENKTPMTKQLIYPLFIGKAIIKGFTLRSGNFSQIKKGDELFLKREKKIVFDFEKKKKAKSTTLKNNNDNIIRILYKESEIGKLENDFSEILSPLLDKNYISLTAHLIHMPVLVEAFTPIIIELSVCLQEKSITKPITRIIEKVKFIENDNEQHILSLYEDTKKSFCELFEMISLKKLSEPLINLPKKINKKFVKEIDIIDKLDSKKKNEFFKINVKDPYQKLPTQRSLFEYSSNGQNNQNNQNNKNNIIKKLDTTFIEGQTSTIAENLDIDYEKLLKIDSSTNETLNLTDPPPSFISNLHIYQKQALTWMLKREGAIDENLETLQQNYRTLHPLWEEYSTPDKIIVYFNPYTGQLSLEFPKSNINCNGGILADEMGLGKTVMIISLLHSHPSNHDKKPVKLMQEPLNQRQSFLKSQIRKGGTLIIVPLTLLSQWEEEILTHSKHNHFNVLAYYGSTRSNNLNLFDVVITTYGVVSNEFANKSGDLYKYEWHRIVLDEAHYIKGRTIQVAKAVYSLESKNRWCVTGTPVQNKLDDLFSLIHFLRIEPWSDYLWWNNYINKPHEKKDPIVFDIIQTIINPILLRRTKKSKNKDGKSIVELPDKETKVEWIILSKKEKQVYDDVHYKSKKEFDDLLSKGAFLSNYMHIFDILTRIRQICDHPFLLLSRSDCASKELMEETIRKFVLKRINENNKILIEPQKHLEILYDEASNQEIVINMDKNKQEAGLNEVYFNETIQKLKTGEVENCAVCLGDIDDAVITVCLHITCRLCMIRSIESCGICPLCRKILNRKDFLTIPRDNKFDIDLTKKFVRSSKMESLMTYIKDLISKNEKGVIFSQFLGMLDLIELDLSNENIKYVRMDGSLSQKKRANVINNFKQKSEITIILISLKAGGVGLNLVEANHVFLIDPWWNPAVEEQAIERLHRIGQKKKVEVVRFICKGTIEERMLEMHKFKKDLFNSSITSKDTDRKQINIECFKYLMDNY